MSLQGSRDVERAQRPPDDKHWAVKGYSWKVNFNIFQEWYGKEKHDVDTCLSKQGGDLNYPAYQLIYFTRLREAGFEDSFTLRNALVRPSVVVVFWHLYWLQIGVCMYMPCCSPWMVAEVGKASGGDIPEPKRGRVASVRAGFSLLEVTSNSWSGTSSMGTWHCKENGGCVLRHFSDFPISWKPWHTITIHNIFPSRYWNILKLERDSMVTNLC